MHVQGRKLENPSRQTYETIISLSETMIINILVSINPDIFLYTCFLTQITSYLSYYFITLFFSQQSLPFYSCKLSLYLISKLYSNFPKNLL